jgi:hypothetical protein
MVMWSVSSTSIKQTCRKGKRDAQKRTSSFMDLLALSQRMARSAGAGRAGSLSGLWRRSLRFGLYPYASHRDYADGNDRGHDPHRNDHRE